MSDKNATIRDQPIDASTRRAIEVRNPADLGEVVGTVPALSAGDISAVYVAASAAQRIWAAAGLLARGAILTETARLLRAEAEHLTTLIVRENGKLWAEAAIEVTKTADFFDYYASFARQPYGTLIADGRPNTQTSTRREAVGVVLLITPWNDPLLTPARKLAPALISGNTVVLKPSTDTPLIALALADIFRRAGLPAGVLTVVTGSGSEISGPLLEAPELAAMSFTGSTAVGNRLRASLAHRNVRVQTEMGGKNAGVIFDSANMDTVVSSVMQAAFVQAGQRCTATSRLIVAASMAEDVLAALSEAARALVAGPGLERASTFGPVINAKQSTEILSYLATARKEGATVIEGGSALTDGALGRGAFIAPTILDRVALDHTVWNEEIFGPVLSVHRLDASGPAFFEEAVRLTNDSSYGLAASIYTENLGEAMEFADRVNAGQIAVNLPTSGWDVHHPFGGFADSGSAFKEQGQEAFSFYTRVKTVAVRFTPPSTH